ncbi:MAG: hypothetical protein MI861_01920, partial [Pirellulales bacterium]|nr:hypothetical protein [Pirellulales bacterium]
MKVNNLLPIPEGTKQPHAYQIFGLEVGEQDATKIRAAIEATISGLKEAKPTADAKAWNQAAKLVQQAKQILDDPDQKARLDARFGVIAVAATGSPATSDGTTSSGATDPLAGVLPSADPLAAVLPASDPLAPVTAAPPPLPGPVQTSSVDSGQGSAAMPPGVFGVPERTPTPSDSQLGSVVIKQPSLQTQRRRKSGMSTIVFAAFALGMVCLIGGMGYFLYFGPGPVSITKSNNGFTISTGSSDNQDTARINRPQAPAEQPLKTRPRDPVMGHLAGDVSPPPRSPAEPNNPPPTGVSGPIPAELNSQTGNVSASNPDQTMTQGSESNPAVSPSGTESMTPVRTGTTTAPVEMTEEMVAQTEAKIKQVA